MKKFTLLILWLFVIQISITYGQFTKLYEFQADNDLFNSGHNTQPVFDGTWLYDVSSYGGSNDYGCIFKIKPDGTGYIKLIDFAGNGDGSVPRGSLTLNGSVLYGMTLFGGINNYGTIYKINTDGTGYTKLMDFNGTTNGGNPDGSLTLSGSVLYGMTNVGGANNYGIIFKINTDGTGFTNLLDFAGTTNGSNPRGSLTLSGSILYGMTYNGGANGQGIIFKINTDGTAFTKLLEFSGTANGSKPRGSLTISSSVLYGVTGFGGTNNSGTIFKINTDGTGYTKLLDFAGASNGRLPTGSLTLSSSVLYGMTYAGGINDQGVIFTLNTDGTGYSKLLDFDGSNKGGLPYGSLTLNGSVLFGTTFYGGANNVGTFFKINIDGSAFTKFLDFKKSIGGSNPYGSLSIAGSILYGTTQSGGINGYGTIYRIGADGTGYTKLLDFDGISNGSGPSGSLTISGSVLYGTTYTGGINDQGTIFKINTDGTGYTKLLDFDGTTDGILPHGCSLTLIGSTLYGMTSYGGINGVGTIFKINTDGTGYTKLLDFDGTTNGSYPHGSLTHIGSVLYGMTLQGGANDLGTIFKINNDGTGYTTLLDFNGTANGSYPDGSLTLSGLFLYGMTGTGGNNDVGTIFKINIDGSGYTKMFDFTETTSGSSPNSSLTLSGSILYGMTNGGGINGKGTIFKIDKDGSGFNKLLDFDGINGKGPIYTDLILANGTFYGTTTKGGTMNAGVLFKYDLPTPPAIGTITQPTCSVATGSLVLNGLLEFESWTLTRNPGGIVTSGTGTSTTISGLAAGTYTFTQTNAIGIISAASADMVINAQPVSPNSPTLGTLTQPTCALETGSIVLSDLPSTGTWTLNPGSITGTGPSKTLTGLAVGTHNYTVTNASGCTSIASANVVIDSQPLTPTAPTIGTITHPTIAVATGSVVLNDLPATGTWTLIRTPGTVTSTGSGTSSTITGLATGTYTYTVANASGCTSSASSNIVINAQPTSGIDDGNSQVANSLGQNYPNPFDRSTTIEFSIVKPSQVTLSVYNTLGKEVGVIVNEFLANGSYTRYWEPKNLPNGIYYYQLRIEGFKATRILIILK